MSSPPMTTPVSPAPADTVSDSQRHSHVVVQRRLARRGRRRLLQFGTVGWVILDFWTGVMAYLLGKSPVPTWACSRRPARFVPAFGGAFSFAILFTIVGHILGLHDTRQRSDRVDMVIRVFTVVCLALALLSMGWSVLTFRHTGRYVLIVTAAVACGVGIHGSTDRVLLDQELCRKCLFPGK